MVFPSINEPLARLRKFRDAFADDATVDAASGLTAADLDMIIHQSAGTAGEVPLEDLTPERLDALSSELPNP
ncbi:MAG: hypothetical protein OSB00_05280 [Sphingomonas bacterium]|nr:hypothetical protein [Sphingomonas bacterium]